MEDYKQRRQREAAQTEQAILQAAMRLCRQKAFDKVSVREICSLAGITTGALAGHENQPPEQRLVIILTSYADFMEGLGWELAARYYQQRLGSCAASTLDPQRFTLRAICQCLDEAGRAGLLHGAPPPEWIADFVFRHFRGVVIDWVLNRGSYRLADKLRQDYRFFEGAFRSGGPAQQPEGAAHP